MPIKAHIKIDSILGIITITESGPDAEKMLRLFSIYVGPQEILLMMDVQFKAALKTPDIHHTIDGIREGIQNKYPKIRYLIIQPAYND